MLNVESGDLRKAGVTQKGQKANCGWKNWTDGGKLRLVGAQVHLTF